MNLFSWNVLDGLLRGTLANTEAPRLVRSLLCWQVVLAAFYGLCLGLFALSARESPDGRFMLGAALKVPILIMGSTAVTLPSLYVFLALFDVQLSFKQVLGGMLAANTIFATVIASMFVGTQLAWILRPFIGQLESDFVWFRGKSGGFVDTVFRAVGEYFSN